MWYIVVWCGVVWWGLELVGVVWVIRFLVRRFCWGFVCVKGVEWLKYNQKQQATVFNNNNNNNNNNMQQPLQTPWSCLMRETNCLV